MNYANEIYEYTKKAIETTRTYLDESSIQPDEYKDLIYKIWGGGNYSYPAIFDCLARGWENELKQKITENNGKVPRTIDKYLIPSYCERENGHKENPNFSGKNFADSCKKFIDKWVEDKLNEQRKKKEHLDFLKNRTKMIRFHLEDIERLKSILKEREQDEQTKRILETLDGIYKIK